MKNQHIVDYITTRKGQFTRASWSRSCKVRKGSPEVTKVTVTTVRAGIDYNSLTAVQEKRANGELPAEPGPLPWGSWLSFPWTISHKDQIYLRLYPGANANSEVQYFSEGETKTYEEVEEYLLASEKRKDNEEPLLCITVKLDDILEVY